MIVKVRAFFVPAAAILMVAAAGTHQVAAQDVGDPLADPSPLDPDQPLPDLPEFGPEVGLEIGPEVGGDFGVAWPDISQPDSKITDPTSPQADAETPAQDDDSAAQDSSVSADADTTVEATPLSENLVAGGRDITRTTVNFANLPGDIDAAFLDRFNQLSALREYRGDDANIAQIRRRSETDRELLTSLLEIAGYYDASVVARFQPTGDDSLAITFDVAAGPQYQLRKVDLNGLNATGEDTPRLRTVYGLDVGDPVNSDNIIAAGIALNEAFAESGYALAAIEEPSLLIDHADRKGELTVNMAPGRKYNFGAIKLSSDRLFDARHLQRIAQFSPGDVYRASEIEDLRRAIIATGLVSSVKLEPVQAENPDAVDIMIDVTPAPLRTVAGEIGYDTGEGFRVEASWEHRNLFPPEGLLRIAAVAGTQEQSGIVTFRRNNFQRRDVVLNARISASNIDRAAFAARTFAIAANIERLSNIIYQKRWSWSAGFELLYSEERESINTPFERYYIAALPGSITYDRSDDLLDPTRGYRISARISPELSLQAGQTGYVRTQLDGSAYYPVSDKIVVAARARFGGIYGPDTARIAPSRRLYAGGGGSVRGYGYQLIGPRDVNNDPVGGRSLTEFSLEARVKLGNFGIVPFIDAGQIGDGNVPGFGKLRYGAGIGARYYSDFGPIRIDVGTPINPQPGDPRIGVYVSLGQAF